MGWVWFIAEVWEKERTGQIRGGGISVTHEAAILPTMSELAEERDQMRSFASPVEPLTDAPGSVKAMTPITEVCRSPGLSVQSA
jgi:hypothetical protein